MNSENKTASLIPLTNAVTVSNGKVTTTSLKIAEIFGKRHDNVIRDIKNLEIPEKWRLLNFEETVRERPNPSEAKPIQSKMYTITRDGFTLLAMGFTGKKAMQFKIAYIEAFNAMEAKLRELQAAPVQPELPLQASQTDMEKLFRMRHNGVPVIPTPDLAKAFGVSVNQLHGIRERNNKIFTETLDLFTVKGVTDNLICRILKAGYDIVPDCVSINLWTQTGARKLQMLLDGSRIKHKQLFCTEIIPAEKKEMPIAERKRPGKTRVKMLFPDIPIGLETRTELGELARAFAERDPEHGLAPYAEYIAYRTMFRKIRLIRQSVEKIDQCGADVSVLSDRSISGAMIL